MNVKSKFKKLIGYCPKNYKMFIQFKDKYNLLVYVYGKK